MARWTMKRPRWALGMALGLAFLLTACSSTPESLLPACPDVRLLEDAKRLFAFREGAGRDLTDLELDARIDLVAGSCDYLPKQNESVVDMQLKIEARRGPAALGHKVDLSYFVAILDANKTILARQEFSLPMVFETNRETAVAIERLEQRIPLKLNEQADAYRVLIGLKLSEDQLEYNRLSGRR